MNLAILIAMVLSGAIGCSLGLLGGGGSILAVPVLVYVAGVEPGAAIGMSLAIVGSASLLGSLRHGREGNLDLRAALAFGVGGVPGAFVGAKLTHLVSGNVLLLLFAGLMLVVAGFMLRRGEKPAAPTAVASMPKTLAAGVGVGLLTGFLGVGGGFLIVPALVLFTRLPMHVAVGTSLLVISINSVAGFLGHLGEGANHLGLTLLFTLPALLCVLRCARLGSRVPAAQLRKGFAYLILGVAVFLVIMNGRNFL